MKVGKYQPCLVNGLEIPLHKNPVPHARCMVEIASGTPSKRYPIFFSIASFKPARVSTKK
jgi:hypothetical protein